jgi:aspartyl-tRNA(Asn)/glutamyl-tRNA(Gln) amidotransferase subunit B
MTDKRYTTVVGLEIHAELLTKTKLFCGCPNTFGGGENENVCPGCRGLPGTLPSLNRTAVELAIKGGIALGCEISLLTGWDRKSYFYADLPNGYQITQFYVPICVGGGIEIGGRFIRLDHIHLEEDAGKLIHDNLRNTTRMDFNRGGVPLIEIVTKPDMRSAEEAVAFVEKVRLALIYAGVCDGRMEQGRLRVDANISVMPEGSEKLGTRVEVKNLNSFRNVALAIEHEAGRQIRTLEEGGALRQETRRCIDASGETEAMREKETAADYRYYPDGDIPPLALESTYIDALRASMPEAPDVRRDRYVKIHGMTESDAGTILARRDVSDFFDGIVALGADPKDALSIVRGEILRNIGEGSGDGDCGAIGVRPADAARLLRMNADGEIGSNNMKKAIGILMRGVGGGLDEILESGDMLIREDPDMLTTVVRDALAANPAAVASLKAGEEKVFGFLMGQCNKILKGTVQPNTLRDELRAQLENGKV